MRRGRAFPLAVAGSVVLATGAWGEQEAARKPPTFRSEVALVTLPVFVTDSAGRPLTGLGAADFEIQDENKPVKIVGFHEVDTGSPTIGEQLRAVPAARRQFLLLFDLSFSSPSGIVRSREAAIEFVKEDLGPHDLAGVATITVQNGIKLLVGFTSDRDQLARAVATLGVLKTDRKPDPLGLAYEYAEPGLPVGGSSLRDPDSDTLAEQALQEEIRQFQVRFRQVERLQYGQKVAMNLHGMGELARALDAVQGRKQILYLSSGYADTAFVGEQGTQAVRDAQAITEGRIWEVQSESHFGDASMRKNMEDALKSFAGSDCVVHTIDVTGLNAEKGDVQEQGGSDTMPVRGRASLARFAEATGGRMIKDTNDLGQALGEILESTRRYYVVAFEPQSQSGPGTFHRLKVRVKGRGLKVSHRTGYAEGSAFEKLSPLARQFEAAEAIVKGLPGGAIGLQALALPYRNAEGRVSVPVILEIDGASLLDRGSAPNLTLEIYGYALSATGRVEDVISVSSRLDLARVGEKIRGHGVQSHAAFTLAPGRHSLRFLVRDGETGRRGVWSSDVDVPGFEAGAPVVYPPLFMGDPTQWLMLPAPSRVTRTLDMPFHVGEDAFTPRLSPRLTNGQAESVCVMAFDGGATYAAGTSFEIKTQLLDSSGEAVRLGKVEVSKAVAETDGFRRFVLNVTPAGVAPGDYTLKVKVRAPGAEHPTEAALPVSFQ